MAKATQKTETQAEETEVQETVEVKDFEKVTLDEFKERVTFRPTISLSIKRDIIKSHLFLLHSFSNKHSETITCGRTRIKSSPQIPVTLTIWIREVYEYSADAIFPSG